MNDTALKNFATWARTTLMDGVRSRMAYYLVDDGADADAAATVDGTLLSEQQRRQRADLLRIVREGGAGVLVERAAYTWFNRIAAIRFMELNDRLPCGMRLLSTKDGMFDRRTQAVEEALVVEIEGLDRQKVLEAIQSSDDERLFRVLFLAQCAELSACMPAVFEPIGSAMELLLPVNLLAQDGLIQHLVEDIPEDDWREGVEIVGWLYQYYNADVKREVFDGYQKGRKASREDIPAATQIFTPDWVVRYMVENSLGKLWMLNCPKSLVATGMPFYIAPVKGAYEEYRRISSPEDIKVLDPACGSGHILVYAFEILARMYEELGHVRRDIPRLILEKNLTGFEIDPRAAQLASFALSMKACELDPRFLRRAVAPHIVVFEPVELDESDHACVPQLAKRKPLLDAMAHLNECGSLFAPESDDLQAIEEAITSCGEASDLFADATRGKLQKMAGLCRELSRKFDAVIANPPYMGSSNMDKWLAGWTKKNYPITRRDLCTCFIDRCCGMLNPGGYLGLTTTNSWMFLSSFEKLRERILSENTLSSLVQLSVHGFKGIAAQVCTFVIAENHSNQALGGFVRLDAFDHHSLQESKTLEAIANPDCGWFYRRCADDFKDIPGTPIAYWASEAALFLFREEACSLSSQVDARVGLISGDGNRFLRLWHEVEVDKINRSALPGEKALGKWFPVQKGGDYRLWYGNQSYVINWENDGWEMKNDNFDHGRLKAHNFNGEQQYKPGITWTSISSARFHCRYSPSGFVYDAAGPLCEVKDREMTFNILAFMSSSVFVYFMSLLNPTLNFPPGYIQVIPFVVPEIGNKRHVEDVTRGQIVLSRIDWDSLETSWDFKRHPLV